MDASVTPFIRCSVARNSHKETETNSVKRVHSNECCYYDNMEGFTPGDEPAEHYDPNLQLHSALRWFTATSSKQLMPLWTLMSCDVSIDSLSANMLDARHLKPVAHMKISRRFLPSSALACRTNCRHAWLPHWSSCGYIQTLTSAACSPNMCCCPVKPNHCVLGEGSAVKRALCNSAIPDRDVLSPLVKHTGRIQTNVLSVTSGFLKGLCGSV